jgi:hypothetical protein
VSRRKRLGVLGTLVWDVIYGRAPGSRPFEEWGGIAYALGAVDAALGEEWELVPLLRVGSDRIAAAREFVAALRRVAPTAAVIEVPWPNNTVVLRYQSQERRTEVLSGGIPPWSWVGLRPLLRDLDALYVNFISGFEMDLEVAGLLRQHFQGPLYCDLHSLTLAVQPDGLRTPQALRDAKEWLRCFDIVQVNESEMALMTSDPMQLVSTAMAEGVSCVFVTMGRRGVAYFAASGFVDAASLQTARSLGSTAGPIRTALVPAAPTRSDEDGDTTGCGDVWGATYFSRLLAGDSFAHAMDAAMRAAARNVEHRGATGLSNYLRGGIAIQ